MATWMMGSESGSDLATVGGRTFGGSDRIDDATFSRTSSVASAMSRSRMKVTMIFAKPSLTIARISSIPLTAAMLSSSGSTTCDTTSPGLEPGSWTRTLTVAGSVRGKRSTFRPMKLNTPNVTRNMISIKAKTGR